MSTSEASSCFPSLANPAQASLPHDRRKDLALWSGVKARAVVRTRDVRPSGGSARPADVRTAAHVCTVPGPRRPRGEQPRRPSAFLQVSLPFPP